jgi:pyruvate carboxylase subunit B
MITAQVKDLCYGLYGETPVPIDPEVRKKALKGYERGEKPIKVRPADVLEPELDKAKALAGDLAKDIDDQLIVAIYPTTGVRFLKWKYGLEEIPAEVKPKTLEQVKELERLVSLAKAGKLVEKVEKPAPEKGPGVRTFNVFVDGDYFEVEVDEVGGAPVVTSVTPMMPQPAVPPAAAAAAPAPAPAAAPAPAKPVAKPAVEGTRIEAPMPGMVIRYEVNEGDSVNEGDVVLILEAMKMENSITAPISGTVLSIPFKSGDSVQKGNTLAVIG